MAKQTTDNEQPLIGKIYLYALPIILIVLVLNLLFNQSARDLVGLKPTSTLSLDFFTSWFSVAKGGKTQPVLKPLVLSASEIKAFQDSFVYDDIPIIVIPPDLADTGNTNKTMIPGGKKDLLAEQERVKLLLSSIWLVPIQGTFLDLQNQWNAIIAKQNCRVGRELVSENPEGVTYSLLAIGRNSAWMIAYHPSIAVTNRPSIPVIDWPDVAMIVDERKSPTSPQRVLTGIRLANGEIIPKGSTLKYANTDVSFTVLELWPSMVIFEAKKGPQTALIGCSLVTQ